MRVHRLTLAARAGADRLVPPAGALRVGAAHAQQLDNT
jgi:hypothetical protein